MKKYEVTIKETLSRKVEVFADSEDDALNQVQDKYDSCDIVLSADDFDGMEMDAKEVVDFDVSFVNGVFELAKQYPGSEKLHNGHVWDDEVHTAIQEGAVDMLVTMKEAIDAKNN